MYPSGSTIAHDVQQNGLLPCLSDAAIVVSKDETLTT